MDVVTLYHFPSPLLATIAIDGIIHNIFEEISDSNAGVKVKDTTVDVKQESVDISTDKIGSVDISTDKIGSIDISTDKIGSVDIATDRRRYSDGSFLLLPI